MATMTIRNLDEDTKMKLRLQAAFNGHSMEEEARRILNRALMHPIAEQGIGSRLRQHFAELGGFELDHANLPDRPPPDFGSDNPQ